MIHLYHLLVLLFQLPLMAMSMCKMSMEDPRMDGISQRVGPRAREDSSARPCIERLTQLWRAPNKDGRDSMLLLSFNSVK